MSDYKGDFPANATVRMTFNTFDSDGASVTITQLATTDVFVYKDGTVLADPDAGVTLDLNEGTGDGAHRVSVDLSSDVQYATGADYEVKFEGADIDGNEVNIFVGEFSIENRYQRGTDSAALASTLNTKVPNNLNTTASGNIGIDWANVENPTTALDLSGTDIQLVDTATTVTDGAKDATVALADKLLAYTQLTLREDSAIALGRATEQEEINQSEGGFGEGSYANVTASQFKIAGEVNGARNDIAAVPTVDEIWAKVMSDLAQGAPAVDASVLTAINFLYESWRNKTETTANKITIYKDDGTTELVTSAIADAAGTFTKDEMISGT
jgi:hypothetical protein